MVQAMEGAMDGKSQNQNQNQKTFAYTLLSQIDEKWRKKRNHDRASFFYSSFEFSAKNENSNS